MVKVLTPRTLQFNIWKYGHSRGGGSRQRHLGQSPMDSAQGESWPHTLGEKPRDNEGREIGVTLGPAKQHLAGPATPPPSWELLGRILP